MTRYTYFAIIAALCLTVASATTQSASLTTASFGAGSTPPGVSFDASTTTSADYTASTGWNTYTGVWYAPGSDNSTIYAYGIKYTSTSLTSILVRPLNATLLSNGTAAKVGDAKISSSDTTISPGTTIVSTTNTGSITVGVGLGAIAIGYVQAVSSCNQVFVQIIQGTSTLVTKQVTSNTCVDCSTASAAGSSYDYIVNNIFYENSTFYVSYTTLLTATPYTTSCGTATQQVLAYLQGYAVSSSATAKWTTAATIYTGTAATTAAPTAAQVLLMCGPQNYTNSTNLYCTYKDGASGGTANLKSVQVPTSSGTAAGANTIATDVLGSGTNYPVNTYTYTGVGFLYSQFQQGILISSALDSLTAASTHAYTNTLNVYNLTSGATATAGGVAISGLTNSVTGYTYSGAGITYGSGYAILDNVKTSATAVNWEYSPFFTNATLNGSKVLVASSGIATSGVGNWFVDANGALWFGANTYDDATPTVLSGSVGKVVAQVYPYSAGNVLASFVALLSLMIAALFAF